MKKIIPAICILSLSIAAFPVMAEDDEYVDEAVDLQEVASRLNVIKADEYVKMMAPVKRTARRGAQAFSEKELKMLIKSQNEIAAQTARRLGQPAPEPVNIDPNDTEAVEELLTPPIYTYDEILK